MKRKQAAGESGQGEDEGRRGQPSGLSDESQSPLCSSLAPRPPRLPLQYAGLEAPSMIGPN